MRSRFLHHKLLRRLARAGAAWARGSALAVTAASAAPDISMQQAFAPYPGDP